MDALPAAGTPYDDGPMFDLRDDAQKKVVDWRVRELERHGMELLDARIIGVRRDIDIHDCLRMLRDGCTPALLKEIVL